MDLGLAGKRALVTGGSRGLGKAVARELAAEGCAVVVAARSEGPLRASAREIGAETGASVQPVAFDVTDPESVRECVTTTAELLGGLDILVNAAARTGGHGELADVYATASEDGMLADYNEKVVGSLRLVRAAEPHLRTAGGGRIVLFSGGAGRVRGGRISAGARNRAVNSLAVSLANALGQYGIGCVSVAPNMAITERRMDALRQAASQTGTPFEEYIRDRALETTVMGRFVLSGDLAKVVCFLCSPASWPINAATVEVSGGSSPDIRYGS